MSYAHQARSTGDIESLTISKVLTLAFLKSLESDSSSLPVTPLPPRTSVQYKNIHSYSPLDIRLFIKYVSL